MTKLDAGLITSLPASDPGSAAVWGSKRINPRPQFCLCLAWSGCPSNDDDDDDIAERVGVSHGSAVNIVNELGFAKVCARWVPRQLLDFHKKARFEACSELIECHRSDKTFLSRIVTGDETWVHHYEPQSKRSSMEWRHPTSPRAKKFKSQRSAGKIMATVFWDIEGVILVDFMP